MESDQVLENAAKYLTQNFFQDSPLKNKVNAETLKNIQKIGHNIFKFNAQAVSPQMKNLLTTILNDSRTPKVLQTAQKAMGMIQDFNTNQIQQFNQFQDTQVIDQAARSIKKSSFNFNFLKVLSFIPFALLKLLVLIWRVFKTGLTLIFLNFILYSLVFIFRLYKISTLIDNLLSDNPIDMALTISKTQKNSDLSSLVNFDPLSFDYTPLSFDYKNVTLNIINEPEQSIYVIFLMYMHYLLSGITFEVDYVWSLINPWMKTRFDKIRQKIENGNLNNSFIQELKNNLEKYDAQRNTSKFPGWIKKLLSKDDFLIPISKLKNFKNVEYADEYAKEFYFFIKYISK